MAPHACGGSSAPSLQETTSFSFNTLLCIRDLHYFESSVNPYPCVNRYVDFQSIKIVIRINPLGVELVLVSLILDLKVPIYTLSYLQIHLLHNASWNNLQFSRHRWSLCGKLPCSHPRLEGGGREKLQQHCRHHHRPKARLSRPRLGHLPRVLHPGFSPSQMG